MTAGKGSLTGRLAGQLKDRLIQEAINRRSRRAEAEALAPPPQSGEGAVRLAPGEDIPEKFFRFDQNPAYQQLRMLRDAARQLGIDDPFFKTHDGTAGATTSMGGRPYINFASYNYLGFNGDARVHQAAKDAIDRYGTSASASRLVSGERPIHAQLEHALTQAYDAEDCITYVSGHATNVSTIATLFGPRDLILHDSLIHNSVMQGVALSGAKRLSFPHNDADALDALLTQNRRQFERVLIVVEGIYSMDGDYPDLPRFVELRNKHRAFLMVDEAHSLGVLGKTGLGIREHFGLRGSDVDIWMGTLSKTLSTCGGYVCGVKPMIEHLKLSAPGFVYSVGLSPPLAAASLAALQIMQQEPWRVDNLRARGAFMIQAARAAGLDVGSSAGLSVIPAIVGSSLKATRLSQAMLARGMNVQPIVHPAVPERSARLRFFMSCEHTEEQMQQTVDALAQEIKRL